MNEERGTYETRPNPLKDTVTIATSDGLKECPGIIVGRGLAVVELPWPSEDGYTGYSITHVPSGTRIFGITLGCFFSVRLALRCARELVRIASFNGRTVDDMPDLRLQMPELRNVAVLYDYLDDLWLEREEAKCQIYPSC